MVSPTPDVARAHRAVEPLHNHVYFSPEQDEYLTAVGLRPGRMCYFAGRAAAMGAVGPGTVTATFANFAPALVARHVPRPWPLPPPEEVLAARLDGARASLTRLLGGADAAAAPEVAELAGLLREACTALTPEGRPLYAAHADQTWPEEPVLSLWHGATLLREHRGDGHVACLVRSGLTGLEARVALRAEIEAGTDELSAAPWEHLGGERTARVVELGRALSARLVANGAYPAGVFAAR